MNSPVIESLHTEYVKVSSTKLNAEQFGTLVMFFPALLVIASDGVIDQEEWVYVKYLSKFMSDTYKKNLTETELAALNQSFYKDLEFLIDNLDTWETRFVKALRTHLDENTHQKELIVETLHLFAEASEGESDDEVEKIEELCEKLALEDFMD
jgi:hypothetical protein